MIKRKTPQLNNNKVSTYAVINIDDGYLDGDPLRREILKVWEESESDHESQQTDSEFQYKDHTKRTQSPTNFSTGTYYLLILIIIGIFIYLCNIYSLKQIEKIKEEYGMDQKVHAPELWWKKALFYNLLVRSFKDSNGDGIGDLKGVVQNTEHLIYLGVDAVILSRIIDSPFDDFGKDVTNFTKISPEYGTLEDLKTLIEHLHERDIKVLLELNPNQSHLRHMYFELSRQNHTIYKDYYVWSNGVITENGTRAPPNNWVSRYGGSAWTWDSVRRQYYYHYYSQHTADFNYWNQNVVKELQDVMLFWLQQGFDGVYLEGCHVVYEIEDLALNEPYSEEFSTSRGEYNSVEHVFTEDHTMIHDLMTLVREWVDFAAVQHDKKLALLVNIEDDQVDDIMRYYQTSNPMSHHLMQITHSTGGRELWDLIDSYTTHLPEGNEGFWMLNQLEPGLYHLEKEVLYQNVLHMLSLLLPGAAITLMGDELAAGSLSKTQVQHLYQNSYQQEILKQMAPLPWQASLNAGFSKVQPWLSLRNHSQALNAEEERARYHKLSPIHLYGKLSRLRKETSFINGNIQYSLVNDHVFSFMRFAKNSAPYLITINIGTTESTDDHTFTAGVQYGKITAYAKPFGETTIRYVEGRTIELDKVTLRPGEGLVLLLLMDIVMDSL